MMALWSRHYVTCRSIESRGSASPFLQKREERLQRYELPHLKD